MGNNLKLCKWPQEEYRDNFERLAKIVKKPKFACKKCGRASRKGKWLCQPDVLKQSSLSKT